MKCPECGKDIYPKVLPHCEGAEFKTPLLDEMETGKAWPCFVISGSGINDPLEAVNKKELDALRAERDDLKAEVIEYQEIFDLQRLRMKEASAHWRAAKGEASTVWPDLGDLLTWLMAEIADLRRSLTGRPLTEDELKANEAFEKRQKRRVTDAKKY